MLVDTPGNPGERSANTLSDIPRASSIDSYNTGKQLHSATMRPARAAYRLRGRSITTLSNGHFLRTVDLARIAVPKSENDRQYQVTRRHDLQQKRYLSTSNSSLANQSTESGEAIKGDAETFEAGPSGLPASTDLLEVYRGMVAQGRLAWDEEQVRIVMKVGRSPPRISCEVYADQAATPSPRGVIRL